MLISRTPESIGTGKTTRQREWEEDEARWEAKLRGLASRKRDGCEPVGLMPRPIRKTSLQLAGKLTRRDALLLPRSLPSFSGNEREDFTCGKCGDVIGSQISPRTIRSQHPEGERLVIRCVCRALNVLIRDGGSAR